jgi:hypothetical protein
MGGPKAIFFKRDFAEPLPVGEAVAYREG